MCSVSQRHESRPQNIGHAAGLQHQTLQLLEDGRIAVALVIVIDTVSSRPALEDAPFDKAPDLPLSGAVCHRGKPRQLYNLDPPR